MTVEDQIQAFLSDQPESKRSELIALDALIRQTSPECKLWFLDGKNEEGKVIANPSIGYGGYVIKYADGSSREFYRIGLSANTSGISVYVLGLADKDHLKREYGDRIGKATVTGYCIRFKSIKQIDLETLRQAIQFGFDTVDQNDFMSLAIPNLPAANLAVARQFYVDRLGFREIFDSSEGGNTGLLGLEREGMRINIDAPMDGHGRKACVTLEVDDIDALFAEWSVSLNLTDAIVDQPWGARTFGFQDPDDNTVFVLSNVTW